MIEDEDMRGGILLLQLRICTHEMGSSLVISHEIGSNMLIFAAVSKNRLEAWPS